MRVAVSVIAICNAAGRRSFGLAFQATVQRLRERLSRATSCFGAAASGVSAAGAVASACVASSAAWACSFNCARLPAWGLTACLRERLRGVVARTLRFAIILGSRAALRCFAQLLLPVYCRVESLDVTLFEALSSMYSDFRLLRGEVSF